MIRQVMVQQDEVIELAGHGELGIISEAALVREFAVWAQVVHRMGGHLRVTTHRQRNPNLEGEAFTVGCIVEWVDRTDDPRPAPEVETLVPAVPVAEPATAPEPQQELEPLPAPPHPSALMADEGDEERQAAAARAAYEQQQAEAGEDGIVYGADGEPEEDMTSIPASAR